MDNLRANPDHTYWVVFGRYLAALGSISLGSQAPAWRGAFLVLRVQ